MILDHQHAHTDIVHHNTSQRHHTPRPGQRSSAGARVLHWCDRQPDSTCVMYRPNLRPSIAAAAIAAATVIAACGSGSPSPPSALTPGGHQTQAHTLQDVVNFADCMRSHGVPSFPDPTTSPREFKHAFLTKSPAFQSAGTVCQHLLPGGGQPNQSPRHSQAQTAALLAFARCVRSHGFSSFPDPNSSGEVTHEMVANAGINLHQPAVLQAGDACTGVTHGIITKAVVARFVAGQ